MMLTGPQKLFSDHRRTGLNGAPFLHTDDADVSAPDSAALAAPWIKLGYSAGFGLTAVCLTVAALSTFAVQVPLPGYIFSATASAPVLTERGGSVHRVAISNGATVKSGEVLLELTDDSSEQMTDGIVRQLVGHHIHADRLKAETQLADAFEPARDMAQNDNDAVRPIIEAQIAVQAEAFAARNKARKEALTTIDVRYAVAKTEHKVLTGRLATKVEARDLNEREMASLRGWSSDNRSDAEILGPLQRESARFGAAIGALKGELRRLSAELTDLEDRRANINETYQRRAQQELVHVSGLIADLESQLVSLNGPQRALQIRAPVSGEIRELLPAKSGDVLPPNTEVAKIIYHTDDVKIRVRVDGDMSQSLRPAMAVHVDVPETSTNQATRRAADTGRTNLSAHIQSIEPFEPTDVTAPRAVVATVTIDRRDGSPAALNSLSEGSVVSVRLTRSGRSVLTTLLSPLLAPESATSETRDGAQP